MTSPPRALHRSNINRILLPDDKVYTLNKSKTPVAVEIECISEYEFETDARSYYISDISFISRSHSASPSPENIVETYQFIGKQLDINS